MADLRDLGNDVLLLMELKAEYLGVPHTPTEINSVPDPDEEEVYTLFDSMPELVDYTFGLDFSTMLLFKPYDRETARPPGHEADDISSAAGEYSYPEVYPDEDQRFLLTHWYGLPVPP